MLFGCHRVRPQFIYHIYIDLTCDIWWQGFYGQPENTLRCGCQKREKYDTQRRRNFLLSTAICIPTLGVEVVRRLVSQMGKRCSKFSRENSINWMVWRWRKLKTKNLCKNLLKLVVCLLRHFFPPFTFSQCFVMQRAFQKLCQTISGKGPPEEWGLRLWLAGFFIHKLCPLEMAFDSMSC